MGAIALVILASIVFVISDVATKAIADWMPTLEIVWFRYLAYAVFALGLMARRPSIPILRSPNIRLQIWRGIAAFGSATLFIASLIWLPVADATAINFVSPLLVIGLSAYWLGEPVGLKRWIASIIGFGGVLLIIQPGSAAFQWQAIFPILAALCWAFALVVTRRMSATDPARLTMAYTALIGLAAASVTLPLEWVTPPPGEWLLVLLVAVTATLGHAFTVIAFGYAPASLLAPLSYVQIVWATFLGYIFFDHVPGAVAILGMDLVVASGLYVAHTGHVRGTPTSRTDQS